MASMAWHGKGPVLEKTRAAGALWPSPRLWWRAVPGLVALGIEVGRCHPKDNGQTEEDEANQPHPHLCVQYTQPLLQ